MASLAENLRTFLLADATISDLVGAKRIHENHAPQPQDPDFGLPFIWYRQSGNDNTGDVLAGSAGAEPYGRHYDLEVIDEDVDDANDLAELVSKELRDFRGTFGTQTVQGVFVSDQSEDYEPRGIDSDTGLHVVPIAVTIIPR